MSGSVINNKCVVIPVVIGFVKIDGSWQIYSITKANSGLEGELAVSQMPPEKMQVKLVHDSLLVFARSVQEKSTLKLYAHISNLWIEQRSLEEIDETFKAFYQFENRLMVLES
ncbi:MAG: hypothetical protein HRU38_12475 [Saccharospirillaceae bacterium]|nr:hypothetical protein [Pseudomonadales bacterium]NRB79462.1 hypothetical protein [Saccharospirillaceae bacterium]